MPFVPADLDIIDKAIKSGVKVVQFQDRRQEFQTTDDMIKARALIAAEVGSASSPPMRRQTRMITKTGW